MEEILLEILGELREGNELNGKRIAQMLDRRNKQVGGPVRAFAKKQVVPYYLKVKSQDPDRWRSWDVDEQLEARFFSALRMKPRRTASGVATITVITKPWPCANRCLYCPNDVRMPKSYLHDEPACQRAERNYFDPYLQVASRLNALVNMGHPTSKIEIIILGGTWADYPREYRIWFVEQLFAALNDGGMMLDNARIRREWYEQAGFSCDADELGRQVAAAQAAVNAGRSTYNEAFHKLYRENVAWRAAESWQSATLEQVYEQHRLNENSPHRVVGLVVETRPDTVSVDSLSLTRQLGATKLQMGVQSLDERVLKANNRATDPKVVASAFDLARLFGFKLHTHFMVNLLGSTPAADKAEYIRFMTERPFQPDEVKIYPCALVAGTGLETHFHDGAWRPYDEGELVDVLVGDVLATPEFCRISRMIRDISAGDIMAGNKKGNLRQLVEEAACETGEPIREIRHREINSQEADPSALAMRETCYQTLHTTEVFLQWVTPENRIAGFLRLSLPEPSFVASCNDLPVLPGQAMIREVHVYGRVADVHGGVASHDEPREAGGEMVPEESALPSKNNALVSGFSDAGARRSGPCDANAQHSGLGKRLITRACDIARDAGYAEINVISAVGTREYYRRLGFRDSELYLVKSLGEEG